MDYKIFLGIIAVVIGFISYLFYFKDIFYGQTRPHAFSWFIWGLLGVTIFFAQVSKGAGAGAWDTGATGLLCFIGFAASLWKGEKEFTLIDKLSFFGGLLGIILWLITKNALNAVVLATVTDFLGFIPTFRKSYSKPFQETLMLYVMSFVKLIFALFAIGSYNLTTVLYPASLVLVNAAFVIMVSIRRQTLKLKVP